MKRLFRSFFLFSLILFNAIFLNVLGQEVNPKQPLRISGNNAYPPYEFINEQGNPDGFNVELFYAIAREMNLEFEMELLSWTQALEKLQSGEVHALMGMLIPPFPDPEKRFTIPHNVLSHSIFSHRKNPFNNLEELHGKRVIVRSGGRMHEYMLETKLSENLTIVETAREALILLDQGNHDAALLENYQGLHFIRQLNLRNIRMRDSGIERHPYAMTVHHENANLLALLNAGLSQVKLKGEYDRLYEKWFGVFQTDFLLRHYIEWIVLGGIFIIGLIAFAVLLRYRVHRTTLHLQESEARYKSIFHNQHTVMLLIDPESGEILDANPAAEKFYGWSQSQLTSMKISQINTLSTEEIREKMKNAEGFRENQFFFPHRLANGQVRIVQVESGSIVLQKKRLLFSIIHDVTEQEKAQKEVKSWQNLLQFIITHAFSAIAVTDHSGRFIFASDSFLKDYGMQATEVLGRTPEEIHHEFHAKWQPVMEKAIMGEVIRQEEDQITLPDGRQESIRWQCRPWFRPDNAIGGIILYFEVITERKKSEELRFNLDMARKTTQIKQTFLASISHEMRTPLNGIIGLSNYLSRTSLSGEQQKHLNVIIESSRTLLQLINQVLNLSKIESEQMPLAMEEIKTRELIQKLKNAFAFLFSEKNVHYMVEVSEDFPATFIYNEHLLLQVMTNLIGNALKFTEKGEVKVYFEKKQSSDGNDELKVYVSDTGLGIQQEHHENIFMEFVQVHDGNEEQQAGTGLGLSISKKIVESFGGKIGVDSSPGKGSTFWFTINPQQITLPTSEKTEHALPERPLRLNVLLVEDKKVNRMVAELILKEMGCNTDHAENGAIAVEKVKHNQYDVILMDIQMPVMDGITAMQVLRKMEIELPPIIGLSAEAMEGDADRYIGLGMDDYLTKPIDAELMFKKLAHVKKK